MRHDNLKPESIPEMLLFSTVRIESVRADGSKSCGTGFFYNHILDETTMLPLVITNKHVIQGAMRGSFHVHLADQNAKDRPSGVFQGFEQGDFESLWIGHPDSKVDLCAMPFQPLRQQVERSGQRLYNAALSSRELPEPELIETLSTLDEIVMPGYPIGIWDQANNMPIIRRGVIASHPNLNFCGKTEFLADIACFPGSSGSPVLLYNSGFYTKKEGGVQVGSRFALVGVIYAGPVYMPNGTVCMEPIPTELKGAVQIQSMVHLACVIKSSEIRKLAEAICSSLGLARTPGQAVPLDR